MAFFLVSAAGAAFAVDPNTGGRAAAVPRFTMLTASAAGAAPKAPVAVSLISITPAIAERGAQVTYLDPTGAQKTIALRDIVALAPATWVPTPETTAPTPDLRTSDLPMPRLDLTDSQRFVGAFPDAEPGAKASTDAPVVFQHERLGTLSFPLDRVLRYTANSRLTPDLGGRALSTTADSVLLVNTDRLEGLVTRLGPTVWIETKPASAADPKAPKAAGSAITQIDAAQVVLVQLVNPLKKLKSLRVDLADGSIVAADAIAAETRIGTLTLHAIDAPATGAASAPLDPTLGASAVTIDLGQLAAVVPDPSRITPLCVLPIAAQAPAAGRVAAAPARVLPDANAPLSAADILLPGPMSVEWALPAGVTSIVGYAQMDDQSFAWGDCTAVVSVVAKSGVERELARARLNADSPTLTIAADLGAVAAGDRLKVRTEANDRGPIQDRIVLRRMVLLGK